jgi:hypothetical protein
MLPGWRRWAASSVARVQSTPRSLRPCLAVAEARWDLHKICIRAAANFMRP